MARLQILTLSINNQMDIVIPEDRMGDFFFLDDEEEKKQYGASADYEQAAQLTQQLMKNATSGKT